MYFAANELVTEELRWRTEEEIDMRRKARDKSSEGTVKRMNSLVECFEVKILGYFEADKTEEGSETEN